MSVVKLRLARAGAKKRPYYRIVVADSRSPRDGRFIEKIGTYDPKLAKDSPERVNRSNSSASTHWLSVGAQPIDRVLRFFDAAGLLKREPRNNPQKAKPRKVDRARRSQGQGDRRQGRCRRRAGSGSGRRSRCDRVSRGWQRATTRTSSCVARIGAAHGFRAVRIRSFTGKTRWRSRPTASWTKRAREQADSSRLVPPKDHLVAQLEGVNATATACELLTTSNSTSRATSCPRPKRCEDDSITPTCLGCRGATSTGHTSLGVVSGDPEFRRRRPHRGRKNAEEIRHKLKKFRSLTS